MPKRERGGRPQKKGELGPPDQLPPVSCSLSLKSARDFEVSRCGERGEYRAIKGVPIINSMRCEKITPTQKEARAR
jgi:hypothetical protein